MQRSCNACKWCKVVTLEGLQEEAKPLATFIASQGAEQCGFVILDL